MALSDAALAALFAELERLDKPGLVHLHIPKSGGTALLKAARLSELAYLSVGRMQMKSDCANPLVCTHRKCAVSRKQMNAFLYAVAETGPTSGPDAELASETPEVRPRWFVQLGHRPVSSRLFASLPTRARLVFVLRDTEDRFASLLRYHSQNYAYLVNSLRVPWPGRGWLFFSPRYKSPVIERRKTWSWMAAKEHRSLVRMRWALVFYFNRKGAIKNSKYFTSALTGQAMLYGDLLPASVLEEVQHPALLPVPIKRLDAFMTEVLEVEPVRDNVSSASAVTQQDIDRMRASWRASARYQAEQQLFARISQAETVF